MNQWKVILATMVIFGSGVITGALVSRLDHQRVRNSSPAISKQAGQQTPKSSPAPWQLERIDFMRRMEKQLDLTTNQLEHIEKIMHGSQDRTKPIWEQIAPQMQAELKKTQDEIRQELSPAQLKKFEDLLRPRRKGEGNLTPEERRRRQMLNSTNAVTTNAVTAPQ